MEEKIWVNSKNLEIPIFINQEVGVLDWTISGDKEVSQNVNVLKLNKIIGKISDLVFYILLLKKYHGDEKYLHL